MPRFSVVIPSYNRAHLIARTVESALEQTFSDYEIVVVDDGSTDHTPKVLRAYQDRARIVCKEHRGLGHTRNVGVQQARGDYLVYLDSDDLLFPWSLALLDELVERNRNPALVLSRAQRFSHESELERVIRHAASFDVWDDYLQATRTRYGITVAGAIRKDVLLAHGGFSEREISTEDHDFWLRIGTAPGFVYLHTPPIYAYRQHPATKSHQANGLYQGMRFLFEQERRGAYAGGAARRRERHVMLGRILFYLIRRMLQAGSFGPALELYMRGLPYYLRTGERAFAQRGALLLLRKLPVAIKRQLERLIPPSSKGSSPTPTN
jgi:glycosyltransferase involved in cell wall biosynthesis